MVRIVESIEKTAPGGNALVRYVVPDGQTPGTFPEGTVIEFSNDIVGLDGIA